MSELKVKWAGLNKFGFGEVKIDDGTQWGTAYSNGKKGESPNCKSGDSITADLGKNKKGYGTIDNIVVVKGGGTGTAGGKTFNKSGAEFRTPDQIMRGEAVAQTINNFTEEKTVEEITMFADELYEYVKNGATPVATNQMPEDEPPFPE